MSTQKTKDIGLDVEAPKDVCEDALCPFHGNLKVRGRIFTGTVVSDKAAKSVVVEWPYLIKVKKYERYMRKRSRVVAHNPSCINARKGDSVKVAECRPISKTKKFVVIENITKAK